MNNKSLLAAAVALAIAGCAVGPDYQRPTLELPESKGTQAVVPADGWWLVFKDQTLDKLVREALSNNNDLLAAAARVAEAEAQLGITRADQLPTTYASAGRSRSRASEKTDTFQSGIPLQTTSNRAALNVSYDIDFWGKYRRATEAARADLLSVDANRDAVRLALENRVASGYISLLSLDAQLAATQQGVQRAREAFEMQKQRYAAGVSSEFEFRQREAEYEGALAQLPPAEEALAKQERALLILLGRSAKGVINDRIERTSTITAPARLPAGMPSTLILNRPDVREAEQKLIAANARIGVARAAFFPSISLTGNIGGESGALADLFSGPARTWKFAGDLTQPLWGAGRLFAAQDAANARNEQAVQAYRSAVANAFKEVADAIAAHARASQVAEAETKRVAALTRTWQLAKLRFEKGVSSQLDVIDAERGLLQAEFDRIAAERDLRLAVADLYKALGGAATPAS